MATPQRIWLIGGTQESAELARSLIQRQIPCVVSVTTAAARSLYLADPQLQVWVGRLSPESLPKFLQEHLIAAVLDASHPFAVEISQLAIATAAQFGIPYLRYERPALQGSGVRREKHSTVITLESFSTLVAGDYLMNQRVLLAVGYRSLALFKPWQEKATLFARILPSVIALESAIVAGFSTDRIIALRPPISADVERALWRQWQISIVVTKASGTAGGEDIKRQVAAELGVKLVAITRPEIIYPQQTSDGAIAVQWCQQQLG